MITIKRIYDEPQKKDGFRILVDRLWPRGISKEKAQTDLWIKEIAPSNKLRKWFSHDPDKWNEFKKEYSFELRDKSALVQKIKQLEKKEKNITLLYSTKDKTYNNAVALKECLKNGFPSNS